MISKRLSLETPLIKTLLGQNLSPVEIFQKAKWGENAFLLDGSMQGWFDGAYSLIGGCPFGIFQSKGKSSCFNYLGIGKPKEFRSEGDPLKALQGWLDKFQMKGFPDEAFPRVPFLHGGVLGFFGYELAQQFEALPPALEDDWGLPDITLLFLNLFVVLDHIQDAIHIVYNPAPEIRMGKEALLVRQQGQLQIEAIEKDLSSSRISPRYDHSLSETIHAMPACTPETYIKMVDHAKEYISAGDIFQANLSYRFTAQYSGDSLFPVYQRLQEINPSPFSCYLHLGEIEIASGSPERLVRIKKGQEGHVVETRPIAGTKPRGRNAAEDEVLIQSLYASRKEQAEHLMMVDLERNDLGKICRYGSVAVDAMMTLERYSHVFHLVSNIRGELLPETSPLQVLKALFPGGTITGVPKIRCMEIIAELERSARGIYTGAIGYIGFDGEMDLNIAIRTWVRKGNRMSFQVGAGIVADSNPQSEYQETLQKAAALQEAIRA